MKALTEEYLDSLTLEELKDLSRSNKMNEADKKLIGEQTKKRFAKGVKKLESSVDSLNATINQ